MTKHRLYKVAHEAALHAGQYAYAGRRLKKRDLRRSWIQRISGALIDFDLTYSKFVHLLKQKKIDLNRKILAELVTEDSSAFKKIVEEAKTAS
jgi:large subunit ribosomal protein L20